MFVFYQIASPNCVIYRRHFARYPARAVSLRIVRQEPLNAETPLDEMVGGVITPTASFYVRSHFTPPRLDPAAWRLQVGGLVDRPLSLSLADIQNLPAQTLTVTLECAGNGRSMLNPPVDGEQWSLGAVSTAEWTGAPLAAVLERAGVQPLARELLFAGADRGPAGGGSQAIAFERSLPVEALAGSDALLAYAMNGEVLPIDHGYPVRLVMPRYYGIASVKWLAWIEAIPSAFEGFFQVQRYVYEWQRPGGVVNEPVTVQRVRALIARPQPDEELPRGGIAIRGLAWSGAGPVERVEVCLDDGAWQEARLVGASNPNSWRWWELLTRLDTPGRVRIRARAFDAAGNGQPEKPEWNRLGYGANAIQEIAVSVV
jgi:DMSO/TMAO reductase YedYZ molybdopterin-dependent catalytic subunit